LADAGLIGSPDDFSLQALPSNPGRLDCDQRASFLVQAGDRTPFHLTVGPCLSSLAERTRAFAEACPEIACRFLFFRQDGSADFLAREYFEGEPLDLLVRSGRLPIARANAHAAAIQASLEKTAQPSSREAAAKEIEAFRSEVLASPLFSDRDRAFLDEFIFPLIRAGLLAGPCRIRWTNGDFVPPNVLVSPSGKPCLIDCEFAGRTHFFAEDSWRWTAFAGLSPDGLSFPSPSGAVLEPWVEAHAILRQLVLSHRINKAPLAAAIADRFSGRLVQIAARPGSSHRLAELLAALARTKPFPLTPQGPMASAQLFWGRDGKHGEEHSQKIAYPPGREAIVRFTLPALRGPIDLRLDPSEIPGMLEISGVRVIAGDNMLFEASTEAGWTGLEPSRGLLGISGRLSLSLLCTDHDPILLLPTIDAGPSPRDLVCEVRLRFVDGPFDLPGLSVP
jgi:hypothetical protein